MAERFLFIKYLLSLAKEVDFQIAKYRAARESLLKKNCTIKPYHDFYNDPNQ